MAGVSGLGSCFLVALVVVVGGALVWHEQWGLLRLLGPHHGRLFLK